MRILPIRAPLSVLTSGIMLVGCTSSVGPQKSPVPAPHAWSQLPDIPSGAGLNAPLTFSADVDVDHLWWMRFEDAALDALVTEALTNNTTLQIAKARVAEAHAERNAARASLWPQINGGMGAQRGNLGYFTGDKDIYLLEVEAIGSWEVDLFGRNRIRTSAANAILESERATQQAIRIGLLAEIARNYFDLRNDERQLALARRNLETQKKTLELVRNQHQAEMASDLDIQRASAQVAATEASIPVLQTAHDAASHRLNVLLGREPGTSHAALATSQALKPLDHRILIAAPAKVLSARPDIRAAERRFAASLSAKRVADLSIFPEISLTGFFGRQASTPFTSTPWGLSVDLVQPILNFGRIEAQIAAADARQKQAFLNYKATVLEALENMEDVLSAYLHETVTNASLTEAADHARRAASLVKQAYAAGQVSLLDVLEAEHAMLVAESAQAASDYRLRNDLAGVYAASGGGWDAHVPPDAPSRGHSEAPTTAK